MNTPTQQTTLNKDEFRTWLKEAYFANAGDDLEQRYWSYVQPEFPRLEEFWRVFVVPLTNRLTGDRRSSNIHFPNGVDPTLQYICGANYSLYVHLAFAKVILTKWDDTSLDAIYTRLASAFDVFEGLVIKFYLLMCECRGITSPLLSKLSPEDFSALATKYYNDKDGYPKFHDFFLKVGKKPSSFIVPPTKGQFLDEYFEGDSLKIYHKVSGDIRAFRNAIVHDVQVGRLERPDKLILVPKSEASVISRYRQWSAIEKASKDENVIEKDFCEVKAQSAADIELTVRLLNNLYEQLLADFEKEFYAGGQSRLRDLFGIDFSNNSHQEIPPISPEALTIEYLAESGPVPLSGVFTPPPKDTPL